MKASRVYRSEINYCKLALFISEQNNDHVKIPLPSKKLNPLLIKKEKSN